jgi:hypothetical protein
MRYDNNLKSFNFFKVINRSIIQHKEKLNLKYLLMVIIGVNSGNKYLYKAIKPSSSTLLVVINNTIVA